MARLTSTSYRTWVTLPTISEFVYELARAHRIPRYAVQVYYAFDAVYYTYLQRKLYMLVYSRKLQAWVILFMHVSDIRKNFIPIIQESLECTGV